MWILSCLFARRKTFCRHGENTGDRASLLLKFLSGFLCLFACGDLSSSPELPLSEKDSDFSTGDCDAQGKPLVYVNLLLPWNEVSFRSRALFPVHIWRQRTLLRGQEPQDLKFQKSLCARWAFSLRVLPPPSPASGDVAPGFPNSATFSFSPLVAYEATAHGPLCPLPIFSALSPCPSINVSFPRCQRSCFCSQLCNSKIIPGARLTSKNTARRKHREHTPSNTSAENSAIH